MHGELTGSVAMAVCIACKHVTPQSTPLSMTAMRHIAQTCGREDEHCVPGTRHALPGQVEEMRIRSMG
jgi:hypothetical protein